MTGSGMTGTRTLADQGARDRIRSDLDATLFVEAAAGTGKTTALVGRIVEVLKTGRGTLENVVGVTFTEKAAGEMKLRLRAAIEEVRKAVDELTDEERAHLDRALEQLELAHIGTIHGFCTDLLKERPIEAGIDPKFAVAAEEEQGRLLDRAFDSWFQRVLDDPPVGIRRALRRRYRRNSGGPRAALRKAAGDLVEHRDFETPWRRPENWDRRAELDRAVAMLEELAELGRRPGVQPRDYLTRNLHEIGRWLHELELREQIYGRDYDGLEARLRSFLRWRKAGWHWTGFKRSEFAPGLPKDVVLARRDEVKAQIEEILAAADADLAGLLHEELRPVIAAYEDLKRREGKLDFVDLLLRTRNFIRDHDAIRSHYQRRFSHFFVDEFQDTDPLQAEILMLLCAEARGGREGEPHAPEAMTPPATPTPVPGKLFLVGDPKQSIYRFRRADVMLYERTKRLLETAGAEVLQLRTSFRSQPRIQDAVNASFAPRMTGSGDGSQADYVPLAPYRDDLEDQPAVIALPVPRPYGKFGAVYKRAVDASLPDAVGAFIGWLVGESNWKILERDDEGELVPVGMEARHICLLFRRFQSWGDDVTRPYVRALEARDIPHVLVGGRSYFDREEVLAVRNALTAIEWPDDVLAVYGALRGPLFSLPDDVLLAFRDRIARKLHPLNPFGEHARLGKGTDERTRSGIDAMRSAGVDSELCAVSEALAILGRLHRERNRRPIPETIGRLLAAVRAHASIAIWPTGEQALANVLRMIDRAREFERDGAASFRAFLDRLEDEADRGQSEEAPIVEEGTEGVRIMTVHKAKGLEFPVVIPCDMTCPATFERTTRHVDAERGLWAKPLCGAAPLELIENQEVEAARERAEADRLTYVASTRVRDLLVVPVLGDGKAEGDAQEWWLDSLDPALFPDDEQRRAPEPATELGCPEFGDDSVLERPDDRDGRPTPRPANSVAPGLYRGEAGAEVVWWDPKALELGVDAPTAERQQQLLEVDEEEQRSIPAEQGIRQYEEWREAHDGAVATGMAPRFDVVTVKARAAEQAEVGKQAVAVGPVPDIEVEWVEVPRTDGGQRPGGERFGTLVHAALATVPLVADEAAARRAVRAHAIRLGAPEHEVEAASVLVIRALGQPILERAAAAGERGEAHRELPLFRTDRSDSSALGPGTLIEGVADLVFRDAGEDGRPRWTVVDFKTDRDIERARNLYELQIHGYAAALHEVTGERCIGLVVSL